MPITLKFVKTWSEFQGSQPEFSSRVEACLRRHPHHVMATLRRDGSPRVSGINVFINDGVLWCGSMANSRKVSDLDRDSRMALHSAPLSETLVGGDARITGVAKQLSPSLVMKWRPESPEDGRYFEILLNEVSLVTVADEKLVIEMWDTSHQLRIVERI